MRHNISVEGFAFRLRPICDTDAPFVVELRSNPQLNRYIHSNSSKIEDQLRWFSDYYEREGDFYFVVESLDGTPEGLISIYELDKSALCAEWGRWVMKPESLAAVESVFLMYRAAFERLGLKMVYSRTVADNSRVVSFHDSCDIPDRRVLSEHFELDGKKFDAIEHRVRRETWEKISAKLENLSKQTARRISK